MIINHLIGDGSCEYPLVIKHGVLEKGSSIGDLPSKTSMCGGLSIAMFDYRRVMGMNYKLFLMEIMVNKCEYWVSTIKY